LLPGRSFCFLWKGKAMAKGRDTTTIHTPEGYLKAVDENLLIKGESRGAFIQRILWLLLTERFQVVRDDEGEIIGIEKTDRKRLKSYPEPLTRGRAKKV